jgi:hypothetical protein
MIIVVVGSIIYIIYKYFTLFGELETTNNHL